MAYGRSITAFLKDETGATAIEYCLIIAIFVLGTLAGLRAMGDGVTTAWNSTIVPEAGAALTGG